MWDRNKLLRTIQSLKDLISADPRSASVHIYNDAIDLLGEMESMYSASFLPAGTEMAIGVDYGAGPSVTTLMLKSPFGQMVKLGPHVGGVYGQQGQLLAVKYEIPQQPHRMTTIAGQRVCIDCALGAMNSLNMMQQGQQTFIEQE